MLRHVILVLAIASSLAMAACSKSGKESDQTEKSAQAERSLIISAEDLLTVSSGTLAIGPVIAGSIQPERRADLRAEVGAVVLQVLKENGDAVKRGDLLVRLDATAIRDSLASAEEAARASGQTFDQAQRQRQFPTAQRLLILADAGGSNSCRSRVWKMLLQGATVRCQRARSDGLPLSAGLLEVESDRASAV